MNMERLSHEAVIRSVAEEARIKERPARVLAVDDEEFNLEILIKHLKKAGFDTAEANSGEAAWEYLKQNPDKVDIVLLDKMMPGMNGVELTRKIKADPQLKHIIVILQTASVGTQAVVEGIEAGAYYYLTKPYAAEVLISIVQSAARDFRQQSHAGKDKDIVKKDVLRLIHKSEFYFRTMEEARTLSIYLSHFARDPARVAIGISGLLVNAVEHGNLEIGYQRKTDLLREGLLEEEILRRQADPQYKDRRVFVKLNRERDKIFIHIKDQGPGFNPRPYLDFDPNRITDPNGRGIAMANLMEQCKIEFLGHGNEVLVTIQG